MAYPEISDIEAAEARGREALILQPRAARVRYEAGSDRIVMDLTNGSTFAFPRKLAQGLEGAAASQLEKVAVVGIGFGIHWEDLDVDLSVAGLLAGRFGTRAHMERLAQEAGATSHAA